MIGGSDVKVASEMWPSWVLEDLSEIQAEDVLWPLEGY